MLWHPEHWNEESGFFKVPNCVLQTASRRRWVKYWNLQKKKDRVMGKPKTGIMQGDNKQCERIQIFIDRKVISTQNRHAHYCQVQLRQVSFLRYPCLIRAPFVPLNSCRTVDEIIYLQEESTDHQSTTTFISVYCLQNVLAFAKALNQAIKKNTYYNEVRPFNTEVKDNLFILRRSNRVICLSYEYTSIYGLSLLFAIH